MALVQSDITTELTTAVFSVPSYTIDALLSVTVEPTMLFFVIEKFSVTLVFVTVSVAFTFHEPTSTYAPAPVDG